MAELAEDLVREAPAPARKPEDGYVDFYGHAPGAGGWLFCGWSRARWHPEAAPPRVVAHFRHGEAAAEAVLACWFPRPDLGRRGAGLIVLVPAGPQPLGDLVGLELVGATPAETLRLSPVRPLVQLREADLLARILPPLREAPPGAARARLIALAGRRGYAGRDTLHELPAPVQLGVDEVVAAPPDGLALIGWCLDPDEAVAAIRVRGPGGTATLEERLLRLPRPDVIESLGAKFGLTDANVGFLAFAPGCAGAAYLEVELKTGEVGYQRLPAPGRTGLAAARRLLEAVRLGPDEMDHAFDRVLGPALGAIHRARLARPRPAQVIAYGTSPEAPECSVVVPLYGRMDFLAYQLALFSEHPANAGLDLIYVLDDPPRKRELMDLAHSAHRRFGLPFRLVLPAENLGYGPANNLGIAHARGEFLCLLNSDVMPAPDAPAWLETMIAGLRADPSLGIMGALLLFEDGTVQHEGLAFERLPQQGNWPFPVHPRKGLRPRAEPATGPEPVEAATGACLVLRRALAEELGGFDETFAIGDFEDSDLCLRVRAKGLGCAVDRRARLYHLERQSQVTPDNLWRHHATLLNAWTHTRRWFSAVEPG